MISSSSNQHIKHLKQLRDKKKARKSEGLCFVEGLREVSRAIQSGLTCNQLVYCPDSANPATKSLIADTPSEHAALEVSQEVFNELTVRDEQAFLVGVFAVPKRDLNALELNQKSALLVIENLEKPGNLGAVLRSADGAGIGGIILTEQSVDAFNPNVIRASLGTVFSIPVFQMGNEDARSYLTENDFNLFAATPRATKNYHDGDFTKRTAFLLGNEASGLSDFWLSQCTGISLPMLGIADSLNISATAAILCYEALRQNSVK